MPSPGPSRAVVDVVKTPGIVTVAPHFPERAYVGFNLRRIARYRKINCPACEMVGPLLAALAGVFQRPAVGGVNLDRAEPARNFVECYFQFDRRAPTGVIPNYLRRPEYRDESLGSACTCTEEKRNSKDCKNGFP